MTAESLTWEVTDPGVATITADGIVTGRGAGATLVRVAAGPLRDSITVTVTLAAVATIDIIAPDSVLAEGDSLVFTAVPRDRAGRPLTRPVVWSISDPAKARVDTAGKVTGLDHGGLLVFAKSGSAIRSVPLRVYLEFVSVSASEHVCGLTRSGSVYCWGPNTAGQLGNGQTTDAVSPVRARLPVPAHAIATGFSYTCAAGPVTLWCWGRNDFGQLGQPTSGPDQCPATSCSLTPLSTTVPSPSVDVTAGLLASCAVRGDGLAACWGFGESVGDGIGLLRSPPDTLYGGHRFKQVSQGSDDACGLTLSDSLLCWGQNQYGETGQPAPSVSSVPTAVSTPLHFTNISAGNNFTCGVTDTSDGYCWGWNTYYQLGDGTTSSTHTPVPVSGQHKFTAISAGNAHACALTQSGEIWCWGTNYTGALGPNGFVAAPAPVQVPFFQAFTSVSAGSTMSCGMATNGRLYCWGYRAGAAGPLLHTSPVAVDYQR